MLGAAPPLEGARGPALARGEIDRDAKLWLLPPERMKNRQPHISPLPTQAIALLRRMQVVSEGR